MNKTSNNEAARSVLLALAPDGAPLAASGPAFDAALRAAQQRVRDWLRSQGLRDGDITIVVGSGQSRAERGKPRALVELLRTAWRGPGSQTLLDSLPIAGVDGTLANRMKSGAATGQAYLKTGTLSDTRALAGYVRGEERQGLRGGAGRHRRRGRARHAGARRRGRVDRDRRLALAPAPPPSPSPSASARAGP